MQKRKFAMNINGFNRAFLSFALASTIPFTANAASQCKGMEASACQESQDCTWVSSYTTKHGNTVSAYCRAASGKAKKAVESKQQKKSDKTSFNFRSEPADLQHKVREEISG
jgi:hypothetical protein